MSLYDDIDVGSKSIDGKSSSAIGSASSIGFLHAKLHAKRIVSGAKKAASSSSKKLAPVIDFKRLRKPEAPQEVTFNSLTGKMEVIESVQPRPTTVVASLPSLPFTETLGTSFSADEYDPQRPNDYEQIVTEKRKRKDKEKTDEKAKIEAEKLKKKEEKDKRKEDEKRKVGATFAPPPSLIEEDRRVLEAPAAVVAGAKKELEAPSSVLIPALGGSVAAKIMAKMGFREGAGLGKSEQGMSQALLVEKTSKRGGKIIHEKDIQREIAKGLDPTMLKHQSKVIVLRNMVGPGEVDNDLEGETAEECLKYGEVTKVVVYEVADVDEEEAVRIFIEFKRVESAIKALIDLNGRFFGGRVVRASFYNMDRYRREEYLDPVIQ